jgi:hypothetical protein
VRAWAALRLSSAEGRFEAFHATGLTELVGREEELELLLRRWSKAKTGEGQVVLLSGEAGIGKSRLTAALLERLATEPHTRLRYFCSPQHADSAFYPIIRQMERAAGITRDDVLPTKLDKLDAMLAQSSTSAHDAALFAEMLSLPNDGRYPPLDPDPQRRRQRTLEALNLQIRAHRRHSPVCRGDDQGCAGGGERGHRRTNRSGSSVPGAGCPCKPARLSHGAARPARLRQGDSADRISYRT